MPAALARLSRDVVGVANDVGTISTGKQADLVVLSQSPINADPEHIDDIDVVRTYIAGQLAYSRR